MNDLHVSRQGPSWADMLSRGYTGLFFEQPVLNRTATSPRIPALCWWLSGFMRPQDDISSPTRTFVFCYAIPSPQRYQDPLLPGRHQLGVLDRGQEDGDAYGELSQGHLPPSAQDEVYELRSLYSPERPKQHRGRELAGGYGKVISALLIELKSAMGRKKLRLDSNIYEAVQKEGRISCEEDRDAASCVCRVRATSMFNVQGSKLSSCSKFEFSATQDAIHAPRATS